MDAIAAIVLLTIFLPLFLQSRKSGYQRINPEHAQIIQTLLQNRRDKFRDKVSLYDLENWVKLIVIKSNLPLAQMSVRIEFGRLRLDQLSRELKLNNRLKDEFVEMDPKECASTLVQKLMHPYQLTT